MRSANNVVDLHDHPRRRDDWTSPAAVLRPGRDPTPAEAAAIGDVVAIALEFVGSPAQVAAAKAATTPRQRFLALAFTAPGTPAFAALRRLVDAILLADGDLVATKHGLFTKAELAAIGATVERRDGRERWVFPVAYPNGG